MAYSKSFSPIWMYAPAVTDNRPGLMLMRSEEILLAEKPEWVLVFGEYQFPAGWRAGLRLNYNEQYHYFC
jgi:hypothetical protein